MDPRRQRLDQLTRRWRARHDAAVPSDPRLLPAADPEVEGRAARLFPYRETTPSEYAEQYGADMVGFTYDEQRYADPELDAWLRELGRILRARHGWGHG